MDRRRHRLWTALTLWGSLLLAGCSGPSGGRAPAAAQRGGGISGGGQAAAPDPGPAPDTRPAPDQGPAPDTRPVGCWERSFGSPMSPGAGQPSVAAAVPGCADCGALRAGPRAAGLHPQVLSRLRAIERALPPPAVDEPLLWVNSGAREGPPGKSMHNQGLALDLVICGLDTRQTAARLREAGFTCVIEYYDRDGAPCNMAHGDLRGTRWARGAYAPGGRKARSCPRKAYSRQSGCGNRVKRDWSYEGAGAQSPDS